MPDGESFAARPHSASRGCSCYHIHCSCLGARSSAADRANPRITAANALVTAAEARVPGTRRPPDPQLQLGFMNRSLPGLGPMDPLGMTQLQVMQMLPTAGKLGIAGAAHSSIRPSWHSSWRFRRRSSTPSPHDGVLWQRPRRSSSTRRFLRTRMQGFLDSMDFTSHQLYGT